jgi:hypothetical protein
MWPTGRKKVTVVLLPTQTVIVARLIFCGNRICSYSSSFSSSSSFLVGKFSVSSSILNCLFRYRHTISFLVFLFTFFRCLAIFTTFLSVVFFYVGLPFFFFFLLPTHLYYLLYMFSNIIHHSLLYLLGSYLLSFLIFLFLLFLIFIVVSVLVSLCMS